MSGRQERMESCASETDFSPLAEVRNMSEMEYPPSGETPEIIHLENEKDESEDGNDEVFNQDKEKTMESREKRTERKRTTSGVGGRSIRFPCGVCGLGVGVGGVVCGACCLWIHNGKTKKCAGLEGKDEANTDTFRCPKCTESDRKVNAQLRKQTLDQHNIMAKSSKIRERNQSIKRTIQDSSPKKDEIGNMSKNKKQKVDNEYVSNLLETQIFKTCIDCQENYEAIYDEPGELNCWLCGLACHGCKSHRKKQETELYNISKGYTWLCHECKKELKTLKKKNQNWEEVEEEAEDHPPQKNAECIEIDKYQTEYESYIENIKDEDIESIKEGKWMTDIIITYMLNNLQSWLQEIGKNVICLDPTVVQCIRKGEKTVVEDIIKKRGLIDTEYIFLPVNNNDYLDRDAGSHWSLLVYNKSNNEFYHHDPIRGTNNRHALEIVKGMAKASKNFKDRITNIESPQQKNGYDCGTYVIMYANNIAENIVNNALLNKIEVKIDDVTKTRKWIYNYIIEKKGLLVGEKENENREKNKNKKRMEEGEKTKNKIQEKNKLKKKECRFHEIKQNNHRPRTKNVCGRWVNHKCWRGEECTFEHPVMCDSDVNRTDCGRIPCDHYHLQVCSANLSHRICKWGAECKFRHVYNDVQGYGHENNKRRRDSNYDHYDNRLIRSQNSYRYGDGPNDSWSYVRLDGRHQNKQASYNPNM